MVPLLRFAPVCSLALLLLPLREHAATTDRNAFPDSVLLQTPDSRGRRTPATLVRTGLTAAESAEAMTVEVALKLRHANELQQRIDHGEILSHAEIADRYLPRAADYARVKAWLKGQGLTILTDRSSGLSLFAEGSVADMARVFAVQFARVQLHGREYTWAESVPSLPSDVAGPVLGVSGLQPIVLPAHPKPLPLATGASGPAPYVPAQILSAYNVPSGANGAGQTIAIIIDGNYALADLQEFWALTNVPRTGSIVSTNVGGGPGTEGDDTEATLDTEWSSAIAPAANLRVYETPSLAFVGMDLGCQGVYADASTIKGIAAVSMSFVCSLDGEATANELQTSEQWFQLLTAAGITCFAGTGDGGSNPYVNSSSGWLNDPSYAAGVWYPSSDTNVVAVGGTTLNLAADGSVATEAAWGGSGGGESAVLSRPSWQTGDGVPAGSVRLVPDVAAIANPEAGVELIYGLEEGMYGGTSLSTPVWAGICALIDQARASASMNPVGSLPPLLYPLGGTSAFWDIHAGSNGKYSAQGGYDECTGLGVPNVAVLLQDLTGGGAAAGAPVVVSRPGAQEVDLGGNATFSVAVSGAGPLTYSWQRVPAGQSSPVALSDGGIFSGSATATLTLAAPGLQYSGDQYQCVVSNAQGSITTPAESLVVTVPVTVSTLAGSESVSGALDGTGSGAEFDSPWGVVADASGNLYVCDAYNNTIRKITPTGVVTTLAGLAGVTGTADGTGGAARFDYPFGIAIDGQGDLYVADSMNDTIRKVTPQGVVTTIAGTAGTTGSTDGIGTAALFNDPHGIAIDAEGNLYVSDTANETIRKIATDGTVTTLAGTAGVSGAADGQGSAAQFNGPRGMIVDRDGNVYIADTGNCAIRKLAPGGTVTTLVGLAGYPGAENGTGSETRLAGPFDVTLDAVGNLYFTDGYSGCVDVLTPGGVLGTVAGLNGGYGFSDGSGSNARFSEPIGICSDSAGNLYVGDYVDQDIRKLVIPVEIAASPLAQVLDTGSSTVLSVDATGSGLTYQWELNGAPIAGATGSSYFIGSAQAANAGPYSVAVTNSLGTVASAAANVTVTTPSGSGEPTARLINLSSRSEVSVGSNLIVGFAVSGTKHLLIRGDGPTLANFGVPDALPYPYLALFNGSSVQIDQNAGWDNNAALSQLFAQLDAFGFEAGSQDTALFEVLPGGTDTAQISTADGESGVVLAELYDADSISASGRLINLSARALVGSGSNALIAGFVVAGSGTETLLIRGIGPGLAQYGVSNTLSNPILTLYDTPANAQTSPQVIAANAGWGNAPTVGTSPVLATLQPATAAIFSQVGAFKLAAGSADCAMVVTLPTGSYTAQVTGSAGATGNGLVEVYEMPSD